MELSELERKMVNPLVNARQIVVQRSLSDVFLDTFTQTIRLNPTVTIPSTVRPNLVLFLMPSVKNSIVVLFLHYSALRTTFSYMILVLKAPRKGRDILSYVHG